MLAALKAVRAENNGGTLTHSVRALQRANALVVVALGSLRCSTFSRVLGHINLHSAACGNTKIIDEFCRCENFRAKDQLLTGRGCFHTVFLSKISYSRLLLKNAINDAKTAMLWQHLSEVKLYHYILYHIFFILKRGKSDEFSFLSICLQKILYFVLI